MKKAFFVVAAAAAAVCAHAKPITMMSYNIRIGCGLKDPFPFLLRKTFKCCMDHH